MSKCILLSGGIDSIALCYWQKPEWALTIDYGQTAAEAELRAAAQVASQLGIQHLTVKADCSDVGYGEMSGKSLLSEPFVSPSNEWWPFRNQLLVTLAAAKCVPLGVTSILLGSVRSDEKHRDGQPEFIALLNALVAFQEGEIAIEAPAIELSSLELVARSAVPSSVLGWAHSCHRGNRPCTVCRGCTKYQQVWAALSKEKSLK